MVGLTVSMAVLQALRAHLPHLHEILPKYPAAQVDGPASGKKERQMMSRKTKMRTRFPFVVTAKIKRGNGIDLSMCHPLICDEGGKII